MNTNNGYGHRHGHKARDAYELYELEHKPQTLVQKGPSDAAYKPSNVSEEFRADTEEDDVGIYEDLTIDAEAQEFIEWEHHKLKMTKWISSVKESKTFKYLSSYVNY